MIKVLVKALINVIIALESMADNRTIRKYDFCNDIILVISYCTLKYRARFSTLSHKAILYSMQNHINELHTVLYKYQEPLEVLLRYGITAKPKRLGNQKEASLYPMTTITATWF